MRQLLYVSSSTRPDIGDDLSTILLQSRRNNAKNNLTGLLWTDGRRFLQVLEGLHEDVQIAYERIAVDPRHKALKILHDRSASKRTFGFWSMALASDSDMRLAEQLKAADPVVRGTFEGLIAARRSSFV